jgi:outer membrane murein-binding lipoprotein Lpp
MSRTDRAITKEVPVANKIASKNVGASVTVWGILLALSEVLLESGHLINELLGVEWGGKVVIVAGLVVALWGRLRATKTLTLGQGKAALLLLAVLPATVMVPGCVNPQAGNEARSAALPLLAGPWPEIESDARYGVAAKLNDGLITPAHAEARTERIVQYDSLVRTLDR